MARLTDLWAFNLNASSLRLPGSERGGETVCHQTSSSTRAVLRTLAMTLGLAVTWQSAGQGQPSPQPDKVQLETAQPAVANPEFTEPNSVSTAPRPEVASESEPVCRSLSELRQWRKDGVESEAKFDFEAYLVSTGTNWDRVFIEYHRKTAELIADPALTKRLFHLEAGTLLSLRGRGYFDADGNAIYELAESEASSPPKSIHGIPVKLGSGRDDTPLFRLTFVDGEIQEVLKLKDRTLILARDKLANFKVVQTGTNEKLQPSDVGDLWRFVGGIRPNPDKSPRRTLYQFDLMHERQMTPVQGNLLFAGPGLKTFGPGLPSHVRGRSHRSSHFLSPSEVAASPLTVEADERKTPPIQFEGLVAFSDGRRNLCIIDGKQRLHIRTQFASEFPVGSMISGAGEPTLNHRFENGGYRARFTSVDLSPTEQLPSPTCFREVSDLSKDTELPSLVKVKASVEYCVFHETTMDLYLRACQYKFVARVPLGDGDSRLPFSLMTEGGEIECSGMPARHSFDGATDVWSTANHLWIYVASAKDIKVLTGTVMVSTSRLLTSGIVLLASLLCGGFWIRGLSRRIRAGDRSLTEIDHHFQSAFGAMQCGILVVDEQSRVLRSNHHLSSFFGVEPSVESLLSQYVSQMNSSIETPSSMSNLVDASIRSPLGTLSAELQMRGGNRTMRVFTCPIEVLPQNGKTRLWLFEDISEKRLLESELLQSQKMDAVGRLSGGIAHDFNNFLMVIQSSLGMIREDFGSPDEETEHAGLQSAELAVDRASELTKQLLGFARQQRLAKKHVNAISLVEDVEVFASRMVQAPQEFVVEKQCDNVVLNVDPGCIERALLNLCINAIDVTRVKGGRVTLGISTCEDPNLGPSVKFSIVDNGPGISCSDQLRIYDPFFTTKKLGQGTGLGLSVALGIIEQHGGRIDCQSNCAESVVTPSPQDRSPLQQGTRFDVVLPIIPEDPLIADKLSDEHEANDRLDASRLGIESLSVLVIEDDPGFRIASTKMLERLGHHVDSVENAMMGIQRLACEKTDMVLLDLFLPEMSGLEAYQEIRSVWPDLPILFCSGHPLAGTMIKDACHPDTPPLLVKPFTSYQLGQSMDSLLTSNKATGLSESRSKVYQ